ncbi:MAG: helix-turn-helix transcriptional regulator [Gemmatimonadaceae bacterium]
MSRSAADLVLACAHSEARPVYAGDWVRITDFRCRAHPDECGSELHATGHQVVFTRAGLFAGCASHAGRQGVVVDPSRALLLRPGESLHVSHPAPGGHASTVLAFDCGVADAAVASVGGGAAPARGAGFPPTTAAVPPAVLLRLHRVRRAVGDAPAAGRPCETSATPASVALAVEEESLLLLHDVVASAVASPSRGLRGGGAARRHRALAEAAKERLAAAPGAAHRLEELAAALDVSPFHLAHVFRAHAGVPMHQYLLQLRMATAVARIWDGEASLTRLALDLGFSSHSHFTAVFRRHFGATPAAVRNAGTRSPRMGERRPPG